MAIQYRTAIIGCGVVGSATARHMIEQRGLIRDRFGVDLEVAAVVDLDLSRAERVGLPAEILSTDLDATLERDDLDLVVELIGGTTIAFDVVRRSLSGGKHVVTANKALLAYRGAELHAAARAAGTQLAFEASCGGGIPLIRSLVEGLAGNRVEAIYGIVNGTCNFILSEMIERSVSYSEALADAQAGGLAEADPSLDVGGQDSAHKIAILAALAFGVKIDFNRIPVSGIDALELVDVRWAVRLGYVPKLLAIAERNDSGVTLRVSPSFVARRHPLAWVSGPFNAVSVYSYPTGHTMYYGRGAGGSATGGAIVADIVSIANGSYRGVYKNSRVWPDQTKEVHQNGAGQIRGRYYVRTLVEDKPGMMGELATCYGKHGISLASVHQDETAEHGGLESVPVVVVTHEAVEDNILSAVSEIEGMPRVHGKCSVISIIDEPEEHLIND
jgi:homoserine dehydrogenase